MAVDIFEMLLAGSGKASMSQVEEYVQQMAGDGGAGNPGGPAILGEDGKISSENLPSYVDDVREGYYNEQDGKFYENWSEQGGFENEIQGETSIIYINLYDDQNTSYRWIQDQEHPDGIFVLIGGGNITIATEITAQSTNDEVAGAAAVYNAVTAQNVKINIITDEDSTLVDGSYYVYMDDYEDGFYAFRMSQHNTEILMSETQTAGTGAMIFKGSEQNLVIIWTHSNGNRYGKFVAYKGNANTNYNDLVMYKIGNTCGISYNVYLNDSQKVTTVDSSSTNAQIPTAKAVYDAIQSAIYVDPNEVIT